MPRQRLYNSKAWQTLRKHQLRKEPLCRYCADRGLVKSAGVVDHIKPHRGDEVLFFDEGNLQSLCKSCHDGTAQVKDNAGYVRGCDASGLPLDPNHHWSEDKTS